MGVVWGVCVCVEWGGGGGMRGFTHMFVYNFKFYNYIQYNVTLFTSVNTIALECFVVPSTLITHSHQSYTCVFMTPCHCECARSCNLCD